MLSEGFHPSFTVSDIVQTITVEKKSIEVANQVTPNMRRKGA